MSQKRDGDDIKPLVAIVGRPNVGKSTLFNRLTGRRTAIVDDQPGVTRDRIYGEVEWDGRFFDVVDTGGLVAGDTDPAKGGITRSVYTQILKAIHDASCLVFVTDAVDGVTPGDIAVADVLRKSQKHVVLVVNKADNNERSLAAVEMYTLGLGEPHPISALHGIGIGELLDLIVGAIPAHVPSEPAPGAIRVAIVGQPNVGKSSLLNALLDEERVVVDEEAGTTRDSVDVSFRRGGEAYVLIDTAGLKKPRKVEQGIERYSVRRALQSIRRCDVALLLIDASVEHGITEQDCRIANEIDSVGRAQVIALNKWDIAEKDHRTFDAVVDYIHRKMPTLSYIPVVSISAKTKLRLGRLFDMVNHVHENYTRRIPTSELNEFMRELFRAHPPRLKRGALPKLLYATQASAAPPTFVLFMNRAELLEKSYFRYIENQLRSTFDFEGSPLRFEVRRKPQR
ncbi:MAG: ribosome biogenesis GTPase Der [Candidatus Abyssobacteria bacterium SURF_17]|uniref:GTPase Der n=1 Tax=Candidatus Abyssobacteria bacterium SURF_17 TaxID=2093361 RepID=A0A419F991_9BACT|nr:MAG: ribosome biogenesis GTPase Der [Candidatus Abyssubacteria bacterium SURF_17]